MRADPRLVELLVDACRGTLGGPDKDELIYVLMWQSESVLVALRALPAALNAEPDPYDHRSDSCPVCQITERLAMEVQRLKNAIAIYEGAITGIRDRDPEQEDYLQGVLDRAAEAKKEDR